MSAPTPTTSLSASVARLERVRARTVGFVAAVLLALVHHDAFGDPPYWDALLGAFPQAHWLARHAFDPLRLLGETEPYAAGGPCVYPFSVYPWIVAALERVGFDTATRFALLHALSFAAAGAILATVFDMTRARLGSALALLVTLALGVQPLFRALACQMNMDVLLTACGVASFADLARGRGGRAAIWAAAALLVKPTGVIVVGANAAAAALRWARPRWYGLGDETRARARTWTLVHALLGAVFVAEIAISAAFGSTSQGIAPLQGFVPLLTKRLWTLPEFGLMLVVALALVPAVARRAARGAASALELDGAILLVTFTLFYGQYVNVLPRYFLQVWPVLIVLLALALARRSRRALACAGIVLVSFSIGNARGAFHPTKRADWSDPADPRPLYANDGWLLERSLAYRDHQALDRALADALVARPGTIVVTHWPLVHLLATPEFGYVKAPLEVVAAETPISFGPRTVPWDAVFAGERRIADADVVWALSPNVFCGERSRILPGDEVLETLERGGLRSFVVRRVGAGGR